MTQDQTVYCRSCGVAQVSLSFDCESAQDAERILRRFVDEQLSTLGNNSTIDLYSRRRCIGEALITCRCVPPVVR